MSIQEIRSDRSLLVSDSNEMSEQLDSKQLKYPELADLAFDRFFKRNLDLSRYLTKTQYDTYIKMLGREKSECTTRWDSMSKRWSGKFKVVDGQVIFLHAATI